MRILLTGASGFIGRALCLRLARDGHDLVAVERSAVRGRAALGAAVDIVAADSDRDLAAEIERADAVINLAGAPVLGKRWSSRYRQTLRDSRVGVTRRLVGAIRAARSRPAVLLSASAVGVYGDRGDEIVNEASTPGDDFLATLCRDWEAAALEAANSGVRVVLLRTGVVLGRGGGALASMVKPFRVGLGGRVGDGSQYIPWVHLEDAVEAIASVLSDPRASGPINLTAPRPVTAATLARSIGAALGRPAIVGAPSWALRLAVGQGAAVLTSSTRAIPTRLIELGYTFRFREVDEALADCLGDLGPEPVAITEWPDSPYLASRPPRYLLSERVLVDAPLDEVFAFFSAPENLGAITPPAMTFRIETPRPVPMHPGAEIDYRIALGPLPMRWRTRIEAFEPGVRFVDSQERGPYASWWHEHTFEADGDRTWVGDRVFYAPPLGVLGRVANALFIKRQLADIFAFRGAAIRFRFGSHTAVLAGATTRASGT